MKKIYKILVNFCFLFAAMLMLRWLITVTHGFFLIAGLLSLLCIGCPVIIRFSSQAILEEKSKIDIQRSHELPIVFDVKRVLLSYVGVLFLFWLLPAAVFLLPDKTWILIGPPVWLFSFAVIKLTEHTWIAFGFAKRTYWITQGIIIAALVALAIISGLCPLPCARLS